MHSFTYHVPTEVVFGVDAERRTAEYVRKYGGSRVMVIYGGGSAVRSGLLDRICRQLQEAGIACESLGGVQPNPRVSFAREAIAKAAAFGADMVLGLGGKKDFAPHQLSQALGGLFDKAHGACLAAVWGSWARYVCPSNPERFARYARKVWGVDGSLTTDQAALAGIEANEAYFRSLGMPVGLAGLVGVQDDAGLDTLARQCSFGGTRTIGTFQVLDEKDMRAIFASANERQ